MRSRTNNSLRARAESALRIFRELASFDTEWIELTQNAHQLPGKLLSEELQLRQGLQERPIRAVLMGHYEPAQKIDREGDVPRFVAMYEVYTVREHRRLAVAGQMRFMRWGPLAL